MLSELITGANTNPYSVTPWLSQAAGHLNGGVGVRERQTSILGISFVLSVYETEIIKAGARMGCVPAWQNGVK